MADEEQSPLFCTEDISAPHPHVYCAMKGGFIHPPPSCENYGSREGYLEGIQTAMLTHKGIIELCRKKAEEYGWYSFSFMAIQHEAHVGIPDLVLQKVREGKVKTCVLEIKPWGAIRTEIKKGIGQCAYYLLLFRYLQDANPYLVIPEYFAEDLTELYDKWLSWLGLIIYSQNGDIMVIRGENLFTFVP